MSGNKELVDRLLKAGMLSKEEFTCIIDAADEKTLEYLSRKALEVKKKHFGGKIYIRGLIEISNFCRRDCYYCGIRRSNNNLPRYRMRAEEILTCCENGYRLGCRTFVLQGGEDAFFTDDILEDMIRSIKKSFPDCALTLSLGEKSAASYKRLKDAGADRYLLRHETADSGHYAKLHPPEMTLAARRDCLYTLKKIGFQTGAGFMVGSPYQTAESLAEDMLFLKELEPQMVGIGPFIPHPDTPFAAKAEGSVFVTLYMLALLRLMLPKALLPATTALATLSKDGRRRALQAGANVIMPNLTPTEERGLYSLYRGKQFTDAAHSIEAIKEEAHMAGQEIVIDRGDFNV